jgi:osmoprotectant transport system substrate-binding protein
MRKAVLRALVVVVLIVVIGVVAALRASPVRGGERARPVTVASFDFAESRVLAEVYAQALERSDVPVRRAFGLGPREIVAPALVAGLVDVVPEYAGTAVQFLSGGHAEPAPDSALTHDALVRALRGTPARALSSASAQDRNAFVLRREIAERLGITTMSALRAHAQKLTFGGPPECASRPLCLPGLRSAYGIEFREVVPLDAGGRLTRQALKTGIIDVALLFSSDPSIASPDIVELVDDRALQPAENVTPIVRRAAVHRHGAPMIDALAAVSRQLDTAALRELNREAQRSGSIRATAKHWLDERQVP